MVAGVLRRALAPSRRVGPALWRTRGHDHNNNSTGACVSRPTRARVGDARADMIVACTVGAWYALTVRRDDRKSLLVTHVRPGGVAGSTVQEGGTPAVDKAVRMLEASLGAAQNVLGIMASQRKDDAAALERFEAAARRGYPKGLYNLGVFLEKGRGMEHPDAARALEAYAHAARLGHAGAAYNAGVFLLQGRGGAVPQDATRAMAFFRRACDLGLDAEHVTLLQEIGALPPPSPPSACGAAAGALMPGPVQ